MTAEQIKLHLMKAEADIDCIINRLEELLPSYPIAKLNVSVWDQPEEVGNYTVQRVSLSVII